MAKKHNCPAKYRNLGQDAFGDKKKVTAEMLAQFCKNDAYLRKKVIELMDLTDPETRKRFYLLENDDGILTHFMDSTNSYGFDDGNKQFLDCISNKMLYNYQLDNSTNKEIIVDFGDVNETMIDSERSTAEIVNDDSSVGGRGVQIPSNSYYEKIVTQPKKTTKKTVKNIYGSEVQDTTYEGPYGSFSPNGNWGVCYAVNRNYVIPKGCTTIPINGKQLTDKYLRSVKIPTQCLAQTFKPHKTGLLDSVSFNMKTDTKNPKYPCIVEIWDTEHGYPVANFDQFTNMTAKQKQYYKNNYTAMGCLARAVKTVRHTSHALEAFKFSKPTLVKKDKLYAIVLRSPLSPTNNCYNIAGWQRKCFSIDKMNEYKTNGYYGHSFTSLNNGKTWKMYNRDNCGYKEAGRNPHAFGFETKIRPLKSSVVETSETTGEPIISYRDNCDYTINTPFYLYLKPIHSNPIKFIQLSYNYDDFSEKCEVKFQAINNWSSEDDETYGKWVDLDDNAVIHEDDMVTHPTVLLLRAVLTTEDETLTPVLNERLVITLRTDESKESYLLTTPYVPSRDEMLPACIWAEFDTNYQKDSEDVNVAIDIIHTKEVTDEFKLVEPKVNYLREYILEFDASKSIEDFDDDTAIVNYIDNDMVNNGGKFFEFLKKQDPPVYVLGNCEIDVESIVLEPTYNNLKPYLEKYPLDDVSWVINDLTLTNFLEFDKLRGSEFVRYLYNLVPKVYVLNYSSEIPEHELQTITKEYFDSIELSNYPSYCINDVEEKIGCTAPLSNVIISSNELAYVQQENPSTHVDESYLIYSPATEYDDEARGTLKALKIFNKTKDDEREDTNPLILEENTDYYYEDGNLILKVNATTKTFLKIDETHSEHDYQGFKTSVDDDVSNDKYYYQLELTNITQCDLFEHIDYHLNYHDYTKDGKLLTFEKSTKEDLGAGLLRITYYPVWLRGLTEDLLPLRLDLWKEHYIISKIDTGNSARKIIYQTNDNEDVIDPYNYTTTDEIWEFTNDIAEIKTTVNPVDNIRRITVNEDTDDEIDLIEDRDFIVDYNNNTIKFINNVFNNEDIITVRYTPNLTDTALKIGYRVSREDVSSDLHIVSYHLTTRT